MQDLVTAFVDGAAGAHGGTDEVAERIFDAALATIADRGLRKVSLDAVARRAEVNRVTIYRRFGDRDGLLAALAAREGRRMAAHLLTALADLDDPDERLVEGWATATAWAQGHPVLLAVAREDPATLIAAGLADDAALLRLGTAVCAEEVRRAQAAGRAQHVDAGEAGELLARHFVSWVLVPGGALGTADEDALRRHARRTLAPMVLGLPR